MKVFHLSLFLSAIILASCSSITVQSDFDKEADFANYKTYTLKVIPMEDFPEVLDNITKRRLEGFLKEEMERRGYVESETPDLFLTYGVRVDDKQKMVANNYYYNSPYYYGYYGGYGYGWTDIDVVDYKVGTLIVDLVDTKRNELIWYGAGSKVLNGGKSDAEANLRNAVSKIFRYYPGKAGQDL